jgi:molybdate transport system substrate-binding protein
MRRYFAALALFLVLSAEARAETVRIMAAFTFKTALDQVIAAYKADGGGEVVPMYGMTPMLVKQVENMAPADIFLSADSNWMDYLQEHKLIRPETRIELLTADLVVATRSDNAAAPSAAAIGRDFPLQQILGDGRVAMCNPADHPAGRIGRAGLEQLGLWQAVADKVAIAESPPAAVALVARGEAPAAIVFSTDAAGIAGIKVAGIFPKDSHPPIVFPAALLSARHNGDAVRFFEFLTAPKTAVLFQSFGYHALAIAH